MYNQIKEAIENGDFTEINDKITRKDMMYYLISESKQKKAQAVKTKCPCCLKKISAYPVSLTHRAGKYLMGYNYLCKKSEDGWVHHDEVRLFVKNNFKYEKGKVAGKGIDFTSYSNLKLYPWNFIESKSGDQKDVTKRDGLHRVTQRGLQFLRGEIAVPEKIWIMNSEVIRYTEDKVTIATLKNMLFKQTVELYKTF